jgi:hypothetical protein
VSAQPKTHPGFIKVKEKGKKCPSTRVMDIGMCSLMPIYEGCDSGVSIEGADSEEVVEDEVVEGDSKDDVEASGDSEVVEELHPFLSW